MIKINERIAINNKEISDEDLGRILQKVSEKVKTYNEVHDIKVKEFEIITTVALIYFAENNCDFVVLETGLGGRYDCTNVADGMISVITDIGLDHMDILGNSIEEIAENKAGIIKKGNDTVMYMQDKIIDIIRNTCMEKNNTLHLITDNDIKNYSFDKGFQKIDYKKYKDLCVNLKGKCQIKNAALAVEVIDILNSKGYNINLDTIKKGLSTVIHKARFEKLSDIPEIIFDGGHNEDAINNLISNINLYYPNRKRIYIISILKTKDYKTIIDLLSKDKDGIFIFTSGNDENKYRSKEELYCEAKKYLHKGIYMSELQDAVINVKEKCKEEVILIVRKFLCVWRCSK